MHAYIFQELLTFRFMNQILYAFSFSRISATYPSNLVLLDMITWRLFGRNMNLIYYNNKFVVIKREQSQEFIKFNSDQLYAQFHL